MISRLEKKAGIKLKKKDRKQSRKQAAAGRQGLAYDLLSD